MNREIPSAAAASEPLLSIADVERETALPRATIRIWERRYGFPAPLRDERGERCYPQEQVAQLRLMRGLLEQGHRPAKLLAAGAGEIRRLAQEAAASPSQAQSRQSARLLRLLREHDVAALRKELEGRLQRLGLARFAGEELPAMNRLVGESWLAGELQIHEEHLYSDCVYETVRAAVAPLQEALRPEAPQVLLTTFPQEPHGLGLLMAQAMFALEGCPTVSLGTRLPVEQIASGAAAYRADLVGLSFTASMNPMHVVRGLQELRRLLPPTVRIWAGGACPVLRRRTVRGVRAVADVRQIPELLAEDFALPPASRPGS